MTRLFLSGFGRAIALWLSLPLSCLPRANPRRAPLHAVLLFLVWPLFLLLQWLHWLGFALDELLFRGWRRVEVRQPLFVLGPPRSGTTHLHHVLSRDPDVTTFRMWECLFGLSVTGRRLLLLCGRVDRALGRPLGRLGGWIGRCLLSDMDDVHPFSMQAPEEDFLTLMPAMQCFILIVAFPDAEWLWRTARLDRDAPSSERRRLMRYYRACVQKHLYVYGPEKRFLSKNASFSGAAEALLEVFPDARILACDRDPRSTVPSQLSSLKPGLAATGFSGVPEVLRDRLTALLRFYYLHLFDLARREPDRVAIVANADLKHRLAETVIAALTRLERPPGAEFRRRLDALAHESRQFTSGHRYTLAEFGLDEASIERAFADVATAREAFNDRNDGAAGHA
ncbi:MAG: sulfotransferase [Wenzhouxiangellaceae bacterium]